MNQVDFEAFMDKIYDLTPAQFETIFAKTWEHFRYNDDKTLANDQIAWRCKQALMLIQHRTKPKLTK